MWCKVQTYRNETKLNLMVYSRVDVDTNDYRCNNNIWLLKLIVDSYHVQITVILLLVQWNDFMSSLCSGGREAWECFG